jgi:UDP-N-acetylmuramate dehydrogenase
MDRISDRELVELATLCEGEVSLNVNLSEISWWRIGGTADIILRPSSTEQVARLLRWFSLKNKRFIVIGHTSNLLFDDAGLRAPCIQISHRMSDTKISDNIVQAHAGAWVPGLARKLMIAGLGGSEHFCGIPGTLGGLIYMNGGSQRKCIGENIFSVESVDRSGKIKIRTLRECELSYRASIFQKIDEIITSAIMRFECRPRAEIRSEMRAILADRSRKFPRKEPNCGSVFKSNPAMHAEIGPPGAIIERLGFKGKQIGGAIVSPKHANFIVNIGGASSRDVLQLIFEIREAVLASTGFQMEAEVRFVHADGIIEPADYVLNKNTIL